MNNPYQSPLAESDSGAAPDPPLGFRDSNATAGRPVIVTGVLMILYAFVLLVIGVRDAIAPLGMAGSVFAVPVNALVLAGGISLVRRRRGPMSVIGSLALFVPCSGICFLGVPLGCLALIVQRHKRYDAGFKDDMIVEPHG
jgi:hypothetical protein